MNETDTAMMSMQMYFKASDSVVVLFKGWETTSLGEYFATLIFIFLFSLAHEYMTTYRINYTLKKDDAHYGSLISSLLYLLSVTFSYLIMLMVMTFNVGIFFTVLLGLATGFYFFGQTRSNSASDLCCT